MQNFFVSHKNPVTVVLAIILLGGLFAYSKMQTALFPEITFPKIKIIADAGQQPVNKMMITVTRELEKCREAGARFKDDSQYYQPWQLRNKRLHGLES